MEVYTNLARPVSRQQQREAYRLGHGVVSGRASQGAGGDDEMKSPKEA